MRVLCTCGKVLRVDAALKGKTVRCPHCNCKVRIDSDTEVIDLREETTLATQRPREDKPVG
jgi:hypothetical protein